jgi:hypothetical protein
LFLGYQIEASESYHPTTSLSLCLYLSETPQINDFTLSSLAHFIQRGKHYYILLENDEQRSFLDFEHNTNLKLRSLIKDELAFVALVMKVVELNRIEGAGGQEINVLLLDKVNKQEEVLKEMVRLQRIEIERKIPQYFIMPG